MAAGGAVRGRSRVSEGVVKYDTLGHQGGAGVSAFHADTVGDDQQWGAGDDQLGNGLGAGHPQHAVATLNLSLIHI